MKKNLLKDLSTRLDNLSISEAMAQLCELFPGKVVFSTSLGQEDQVITEIIAKHNLPVKIFTLDTGRLFYETYDLLARTESRYKIKIKPYYPNTGSVEKLVSDIGINGFYESPENRKSCCYVRKVEPLKRALAGNSIWITGLRAEQSNNRSGMQKLEWDEGNQIMKFNPLLDWSMDEMLQYISDHNIPYNPLHDKGFVSIGCAPCTRAIEPGEDPRAGRWWWEASHKECGLHIK
ncbi:phosphoadenylyl-sulfate reductase [Echinicola vietnamensis]|uniref:Adenosine 5'-phosphosulfate reductase n=1 Tax=Echinicola vietnamensis (strain DSM 17526 / LMG 23754 / KMM 6221) TaxID=926556 RepID=L0FX76_ECHVK|nr:phosphoadenylyl-sulfate reductase [Echinicola vietnamensis]AGA77255.1 thioredoxin-dependent phosophoadenylyl-sulfate reductase [Echinicola vietnamensis DSM 17526]